MNQPNSQQKPTAPTKPENSDYLQPYSLDYYAQAIVLKYRDEKNVLNESHKMRMAVAYGLERFWGEHLRLQREKQRETKRKGEYWKDVWDKLAEILKTAEMELPNDKLTIDDTDKIQKMAEKIWKMSLPEQRVALMVLTQFCDSLVWWTQRYKKKDSGVTGQNSE